ncbi:MAG: three-helix bundle dimerization domain-containing protein [Egibacteraceae bacterium]
MLGPHDWLEPDVRRQLETVTAALASDFAGTFSPQTVARYVDDTLARWADASIQSYLPVLVRRFVADRLRALAQVKGRVGKDVPEVLFVCVRNAGRSQMAAALLARAADGAVGARSAGSRPADEIHPVVREVLAEIGVYLRGAFPKPLTDEVVLDADVVVSMGCGDACPVLPGKRYLHWDLPDPAGRPLDEVRSIRDDIDHRVRALLAELTPWSGV